MTGNDTVQQMEIGSSISQRNETVKYPTTYFETLMNLFRSTIGAGIFAMGDAFKNSGLIVGCVLTVVIGIINVHCQHILLTISEDFHKNRNLKSPPDYATTVEICFQTGPEWLKPWARTSKRVINAFLCVMQLGFCAVYFVFISRNIQQIFNTYDIHIDIHLYMALILVPIILECLIRNLKFIAPISSIANILMIIGLAITFYYASKDLSPVSDRKYIGSISDLPLFFGTVIYAFVCIGLVIPLKNEMANPDQFQKPLGSLNVGMALVTVLLSAAGFMGYWKWGNEVQGSLTLNLPNDSVLTLSLQGILAIAILFTLPIQFYVPVDIIWPAFNKKYGPFKNPVIPEMLLRVTLVLVTFTMAEAIPHLNIFISFVGATCSISVALIFPAILELVIKSQSAEGISWLVLMKNFIIVILGLIGFVTGTYEGIRAIVNEMSKE